MSKVIVIVGPTSSGKSELSIRVARRVNGEIISADSRQVYRGMDIGSGKVPIKPATNYKLSAISYYKGVRHHLIDVASPKRTFTVARYKKLGVNALGDIIHRGKTPIIVGGTGLYIDALLYEAQIPEVKPNPALRKKLEKENTEELFLKLKKLDPRRARVIDRHNKRRLIRALEIIAETGKPTPLPPSAYKHSHILENMRMSKNDVLILGLNPPSEVLVKRIHKRLLSRMKEGLVAEVRRLHREGTSWKRLDDFGLEYRYVSRYARGMITKQEMVELIEKESMRYAKRQMAWLKRNKDIHWYPSPNAELIFSLLKT